MSRVQSAMEWIASVHTSHMSKPNVARVLSATAWTASVNKVSSCSKCYDMDCFGTYFTHRSLNLRSYLRGSRPSKIPSKGRKLWRYLWRSSSQVLSKVPNSSALGTWRTGVSPHRLGCPQNIAHPVTVEIIQTLQGWSSLLNCRLLLHMVRMLQPRHFFCAKVHVNRIPFLRH